MGKKANRQVRRGLVFLLAALAFMPGTASAGQLPETVNSPTARISERAESPLPERLIPLGKPVGIKMYSAGVMVAEIDQVETEKGTKSPAREAGLKAGDIIEAVSGAPVNTVEELEQTVVKSGGKKLTLLVCRDGENFSVEMNPARAKDGSYRMGAWVRDSMAGIGTISFVDPETGQFGALGHAICDVDSGEIMPLKSGSIMSASVAQVKKGQAGHPGELQGVFELAKDVGRLTDNTGSGIFGVITDKSIYEGASAVPVADASEVKTGKATILSTVSGSVPEEYEIEILRVADFKEPDKNMLIRVQDKRLLDKTGGIVQGMSGSPILQNGKLIGAVTHVLINDPDKGYGVFIGNMLKNNGIIEKKERKSA